MNTARDGLFPRVKEAGGIVGANCLYFRLRANTEHLTIFSAGHAFRLNAEISEEHFMGIVGRYVFQDPQLIDGILEKSTCESFRNLIAGLKQS